MTFTIDLDQVEAMPAGEIKFNPKKWATDFKTSTIFNFLFSESALNNLSKSILDFPDLRSLDTENSYYEKALREYVGNDEAEKMIQDILISGKIKKFPESLESLSFLEIYDLSGILIEKLMFLMEILEFLTSIKGR